MHSLLSFHLFFFFPFLPYFLSFLFSSFSRSSLLSYAFLSPPRRVLCAVAAVASVSAGLRSRSDMLNVVFSSALTADASRDRGFVSELLSVMLHGQPSLFFPSVYLSVCLSVSLSVYLSVCRVCLSVCPYVSSSVSRRVGLCFCGHILSAPLSFSLSLPLSPSVWYAVLRCVLRLIPCLCGFLCHVVLLCAVLLCADGTLSQSLLLVLMQKLVHTDLGTHFRMPADIADVPALAVAAPSAASPPFPLPPSETADSAPAPSASPHSPPPPPPPRLPPYVPPTAHAHSLYAPPTAHTHSDDPTHHAAALDAAASLTQANANVKLQKAVRLLSVFRRRSGGPYDSLYSLLISALLANHQFPAAQALVTAMRPDVSRAKLAFFAECVVSAAARELPAAEAEEVHRALAAHCEFKRKPHARAPHTHTHAQTHTLTDTLTHTLSHTHTHTR